MRKQKAVQLFARQWLIGLVMLAALAAGPAWAATTYYVSPDGDDSSDGLGWSTAKKTIQGGVDLATTGGDVVMVSNGTYTLASTISVNSGITIKSLNNRDVTIVDGGGSNKCFSFNAAGAVLDGFTVTNGYDTSWSGAGVSMSGNGQVLNCIIKGNIESNTWGFGGGIYFQADGLVSNCVIQDNIARYAGGGVYCSGALTIRNSEINNNRTLKSDGWGGGLMIYGGGLVEDCVISNNTSANIGGIYASTEAVVIRQCAIVGNTGHGLLLAGGGEVSDNTVIADNAGSGAGLGGWSFEGTVQCRDLTVRNNTGYGLFFDGSSTIADVSNCVITGNGSIGIYGYEMYVRDCVVTNNGGGISQYTWGTSAGLIENCTITDNTDINNAGGLTLGGATARNCTITRNTSMYGGVYITAGLLDRCSIINNHGSVNQQYYTAVGGIYVYGGTVRNCLVAGNIGYSVNGYAAGGVLLQSGDLENNTIIRNAIAENTPYNSSYAAGLTIPYGGGNVLNTIVAFNHIPASWSAFGYSIAVDYYGNTTGTISNNCIPGVTNNNSISEDPQFVDSGSGYGDSYVAGDYRLNGYSPCINAGLNKAWMTGAADLAGADRLNGTVDIGAYECGAPAARIPQPMNVRASDGYYPDKVRVTWDAVAGATDYLLYRSTGSGGGYWNGISYVTYNPPDWSSYTVVSGTSYDDTNVSGLADFYWYWVVARDAVGHSLAGNGDAGYTAACSVNFDEAHAVFIDENSYLKKIAPSGGISYVLSPTNTTVQRILLNRQGEVFIVFSSQQLLTDGNSFLLAKANPANNTLTGIDSDITSLAWVNNSVCPNIQTDDAGNVYYFALNWGQAGACLRKSLSGTTNIVDLINENVSITNWLVTPEGTVLMAGKTESTSVNWLRKLEGSDLSHVISPPVEVPSLMRFPNGKIYAGIQQWDTYNYPGVYRLSKELTAPTLESPFIGNANSYFAGSQPVFTPENDVNDLIQGVNSNQSRGFFDYNGVLLQRLEVTSNNKVFVMAAAEGTKTIVQYFPIVRIIDPASIDNITAFTTVGNNLVIAGSSGSSEKLILYDPPTGRESDLITENIEIYHLNTMPGGIVWFDGLKFNGNKYIAGKLQVQTTVQAGGLLAPKSAYTEILLSGKPTDFTTLYGQFVTNVVITEPPAASTRLTASDGTYADRVRLAWDFDTYADSYDIYRSVNASSSSATLIGTATSASYEDSAASSYTLYYYWVKAINDLGASDYSASDTGWLRTGSMDVAGDFDGDRIADPAVISASGDWYVWMSSAAFNKSGPFPLSVGTGTALTGDFDGDGKSDPVWVSGNNWYVWMSASAYGGVGPIPLGSSAYTPLVADFDGDRIADPAMVDNNAYWTILLSGSGYAPVGPVQFGTAGCQFIAGDMDSDGRDDPIAVNGAGLWQVYASSSGYVPMTSVQFGTAGNAPVVGDFDGDGKTDIVCVDGGGNWYIYFSSAGFSAASGPYRLIPIP